MDWHQLWEIAATPDNVPIFDWIMRALGVTQCMDGFTGRRP